MRRFVRTIIGLVCLASIVLAGAENADGSCNLAWTLAFMAVAVICAVVLDKTKGHEDRRQG